VLFRSISTKSQPSISEGNASTIKDLEEEIKRIKEENERLKKN
jgi:hypothetical protein